MHRDKNNNWDKWNMQYIKLPQRGEMFFCVRVKQA